MTIPEELDTDFPVPVENLPESPELDEPTGYAGKEEPNTVADTYQRYLWIAIPIVAGVLLLTLFSYALPYFKRDRKV